MKYNELIGKELFCENMRVGKIINIIIDGEEWKVTHFEVELRKEAAFELLGVKSTVRNVLAISAVGPASKAINKNGEIDLQVARGQLRIYLRPP
ncbi:PRC-barrel domain-containing protein [Candidatus Bathyarchaeota archaeon]|nr:PRC-barrel domain-containing protein [Candidatus Bathyarchaeota archaeon]